MKRRRKWRGKNEHKEAEKKRTNNDIEKKRD